MPAYPETFPIGSYGQTIELVVKERSASTGALAVVDISSATNLKFMFRTPKNVPLVRTAQFTNAGTDGKLYYTVEQGLFNENDRAGVLGTWSVKYCFTLGAHVGNPNAGGSTTEWARFIVK